jgi:hypothetical protein
MILRATTLHVVLASLLFCTVGCGQPLQPTTIQLGRSLNSDNSVGTHATTFKRDDTIYVSVLTKGRGAGTIMARWKYVSRLVSEPQKKVSYKDDAATEFHLQNSGGFPAGEYEVEILIDGKPYGSRRFRIE